MIKKLQSIFLSCIISWYLFVLYDPGPRKMNVFLSVSPLLILSCNKGLGSFLYATLNTYIKGFYCNFPFRSPVIEMTVVWLHRWSRVSTSLKTSSRRDKRDGMFRNYRNAITYRYRLTAFQVDRVISIVSAIGRYHDNPLGCTSNWIRLAKVTDYLSKRTCCIDAVWPR